MYCRFSVAEVCKFFSVGFGFFVFVLPSGYCWIIFLLNLLSGKNLVWNLLFRYRITAAFSYWMAWHSLDKVFWEYRASFAQKTVRPRNRRIYVQGNSLCSLQRHFGLSHCNTSLKWVFPQGRHLFNKVMANSQNPFPILKCLFYRKHSVRKTYQLQLLRDRRQTYRYCRFIKTSSNHFLCRSNGSHFPCHNLKTQYQEPRAAALVCEGQVRKLCRKLQLLSVHREVAAWRGRWLKRSKPGSAIQKTGRQLWVNPSGNKTVSMRMYLNIRDGTSAFIGKKDQMIYENSRYFNAFIEAFHECQASWQKLENTFSQGKLCLHSLEL